MAQIQPHPGATSLMVERSTPSYGRSWLASLDAVLGAVVEIPVAILVAAEIVILFAGVVARFALHQPLIWSDELASILFLWLAMLGAVVAFRRNEHMRMTALVSRASPQTRAFLDVFATGAALAFLLLIAWPAFEYAQGRSSSRHLRWRSPMPGVQRPCRSASASWRCSPCYGCRASARFEPLRWLLGLSW
jgi:TRAP-type C4-dicarboxylate transport system permease small subunit